LDEQLPDEREERGDEAPDDFEKLAACFGREGVAVSAESLAGFAEGVRFDD